jgi:hypothetical protein
VNVNVHFIVQRSAFIVRRAQYVMRPALPLQSRANHQWVVPQQRSCVSRAPSHRPPVQRRTSFGVAAFVGNASRFTSSKVEQSRKP